MKSVEEVLAERAKHVRELMENANAVRIGTTSDR
jgi:hypothetical protein